MRTLPLPAQLVAGSLGETLLRLRELLAAGDGLELEASAVAAVDTAGLQLLLAAQRQAEAVGRRLVLAEASPRLVEALRLAGAHERFTLREGRP
jgi:anti-anti-sigma regulatory factor